ncbi:MAG: hypothetical protein ABIH99_05855 [Candidatus Micrarchaeota archaeon]
MQMKNVLLVIALVAVLASSACADILVSSFVVTPSTLRPGAKGTVSFTLTNTGSTAISGVKCYPSGSGFTFASNYIDAGDLGIGGSTSITLPFTTNGDIKSGIYNVLVSSYWSDGTGSQHKTFSVSVNVTDLPVFQILTPTNIAPVGPGGELDVVATIKNTGGKATDMELTTNSSTFFLTSTSKILLGTIGNDAEKEVLLNFSASSSAASGVHTIPVVLEYLDELSVKRQSVLYITPVRVVKSSVDFSVQMAELEDKISPGNRVKIRMNLTNIRSATAYSATVSISSSSAYITPMSSAENYVGDVLPMQMKEVEFEIGVASGASPGYYPLTVTVNYLNREGEEQSAIQQTLGMEVSGVADVSAIASLSPAPATPGAKYALSLQISNIGTIPVGSLFVKVSSEVVDILEAPENYVGTLALNDYTSVQYNVFVKNDVAPGRYPVNVVVSFRDARNALHTMEKITYIEIVSPETAALIKGGNGGTPWWVSLIVLGMIAVLGYFGYKKFVKKK